MCMTGEYFWYEDTCRTHDYNYNEICARLMHVICTRIRACLMNIMPTYYYHTTTVLQPHYFVLLHVTSCYFMLLHITSHDLVLLRVICIVTTVFKVSHEISCYIILWYYYHATIMLLSCFYDAPIMILSCYDHATTILLQVTSNIILPYYYHATIMLLLYDTTNMLLACYYHAIMILLSCYQHATTILLTSVAKVQFLVGVIVVWCLWVRFPLL